MEDELWIYSIPLTFSRGQQRYEWWRMMWVCTWFFIGRAAERAGLDVRVEFSQSERHAAFVDEG